MNELANESSPYLLQHAGNPVFWKAFNRTTLDLALKSDKLIIVSSGYSACHWCHVMEHQSFEDDQVAEVMNRDFVSIKVDREERPDVDAIYMKAVQMMSGQGGWPLNVVCLPDGRPVWGGTYFPKKEWMNALETLSAMYREDRTKVIEYAEKVHQNINAMALFETPEKTAPLSQQLLLPLVDKFKKSFDTTFGGYGRAPKFMLPNNWRFLLRYGYEHHDRELLKHVNLTLEKMAFGGLFDTVGGGFSRYSVDMKWHVPHFEKMLYDNGQLVSLYADAYKLTKNEHYLEVVEKTLAFVNREFLNPDGGFFSALDADSLDTGGHLEEGAFYVWTKSELRDLAGDDFELLSDVFSINDFGHWENGNYVLIQKEPLEAIAKRHNMSIADLSARKEYWEKLLFAEREKRPKPRLDDKCLTSWNAIMCKGFVDAAKATGNRTFLDSAIKNATFIKTKLWSAEGNLFRNYKNSSATINGYLEDYAHVISAFIALYQATMDEKWLTDARQLTDYAFEHFYDANSGFFRFTSDLDDALIAPHYELEDNVIPASNSVMADNLSALAAYFTNDYYESVCWRMLENIVPLADYPSAFANWLSVMLNFSKNSVELAISGPRAAHFAEVVNSGYHPNVLLAASEKKSKLPLLENRFDEDQTLFYVCQNKSCGLPDTDFNNILSKISTPQ